MIPRKPIDWTRALRTTDGHDAVTVERINPESVLPISIHVPATGWRGDVDREGYGREATSVPLVENVPPEPKIVERFVVVAPMDGPGGYSIVGALRLYRGVADEDRNHIPGTISRVARVLIEEPGE